MRDDPAGLGPVLARHRILACPAPEGEPPDLRLPENVAAYVRAMVAAPHRRREHLGGLYLDSDARPLGYTLPYLGYFGRTPLEANVFLRPGVLLLADGLVMFHNRARGKLTASRKILAFVRRVRAAGELVGVRLLDHLILAQEDRWLSLRNAGRARFCALGDVSLPPRSDGRSRVRPKYRHPERQHLTWSGRGKMARWLSDALAAGARLEDFALDQ